MDKRLIYEEVLHAASEVTGLTEEDILNSRTEECTDVRCLVVRYLWSVLPCTTIGILMGRTRQGIRSMMNRNRGDSWLMERNWEAIVKQMESKGFLMR